MLILRFIIVFLVSTRTGLRASMLRKQVSHTVFPCCLKHSVLAPVSLPNTQCPLIGRLIHA